MKPTTSSQLCLAFAVFIFVMLGAASAKAQGTAFTYQGRLTLGGSAVSGNWDVQFKLFDSVTNGNQIGSTISMAPVPVNNGLFSVTLDFGTNAFTGASRWLDLGARTNGSASAYAVMSPRPAVTPVPYAIKAAVAATVDGGSISLDKLAARAIGTNVSVGGVAMSGSSGNFSTTSSSFVDVTNLVVSITNIGRPVFIGLIPDPSASPALVGASNAGNPGDAEFAISRNGQIIATMKVHGSVGGTVFVPPGSVNTLDTPPAGGYTYKLRIRDSSSGAGTAYAQFVRLVAYEL